jgi:hypothetical protein
MSHVLLERILNFDSSEREWGELETLFEEVFTCPNPELYYPAIFSIFEKYPSEDGAGVFWSALHGMERVGKYEAELLRCFRRLPNEMSRIMLIRMRNSGIANVAGFPIERLIGS